MKPTKLEEDILREHFSSADEYNAALARMEQGEPLAYIVGEWYFYGLTFVLNADTLIPRPATELLVDKLIRILPPNARFADLGTGSGCIALSVLTHRKDAAALLLDISENALNAAKANAQALGVADRCTFIRGDMLTYTPDEKFDAIVSNPPYIAREVIPTLSKQVGHEPVRALDGGIDGLDFYRSLVRRMPSRLNKSGFLLLEIGYNQRGSITALCAENGLKCTIERDYGNNDRMALVTQP